LANGFEFDAQIFAEPLEIGEGEHALDFDLVGLLEVIPVFEELRGEVAVVGEEDEPGGGVFEIADGIDAIRKSTKKITQSFAAFGIGERGDDFGRLVKEKVDVARGSAGDFASGGFDLIAGGVGFGAEFGDSFAVDADLAGEDELLGVTTGSDTGASDDLLKTFEHASGVRSRAVAI